MHKKAHDDSSVEKRGKLIIMRGLRVFSRKLGITGQCDIVEFHQNKTGISVSGFDGKWEPIPVEYKRGKAKEGVEDAVQLCAQAICLEEMLLTKITNGFLFYGETKRRAEVIFDKELRNHVETICFEMHSMLERGYTPKVKTSRKCKACSLKNVCMPELNQSVDVTKYISDHIDYMGDGK